jgi:hypothetical protein
MSEILPGELLGVQQRRGNDNAPDAKAGLLDPDAAFSVQEGLGERVVNLSLDRPRPPRLRPRDYVIILAKPRPAAKVGRAV